MRKLLPLSLLVVATACVDHHFESIRPEAYVPHCPEQYEWKAGDYLVFGTFGWCSNGDPECVTIYKMENGTLFEDSFDHFPSVHGGGKPYPGNYSINKQAWLPDVECLAAEFPTELLSYDNGWIGCGMCNDGTAVYVETKINGQIRFWNIDYAAPDLLKQFSSKIYKKVWLLRGLH